jgi:hypothetical protein
MKLSHRRAALCGALLSLLATGCAQIGGTTEVKPDGGFTRTLIFEGDKPKGPRDPEGAMSFSPTLDQLVIVPRMPGWDVKKVYKDSKLTVTATKTFAPGETSVDDLLVKADPKKSESVIGNTASVTKRPDGKLEYREVIRWRGPSEAAPGSEKEIVAELKKSLPEGKASDEAAVDATARRLQKDVVRLLLGPGDPLLGVLLTHPRYAEFKLKKGLGTSLKAALTEGFGDKLTAEERDATVKKMLATVGSEIVNASKPTPPGPPGATDATKGGGKRDGALVAILLKVKLPGKVVETNGELDDESGEVVWPFYSEAAAGGDITLSAVCEP